MQSYLSKHAFTPELIQKPPQWNLGIVVVIPVFRESALPGTVTDLWRCDPCEGAVEVIVVVNDSEQSDPPTKALNVKTYREACNWAALHVDPQKQFHILYQTNLPKKKAGVGLARKIGMDEAIRRFDKAGNPDGVIVCLDADCRVDTGYLREIESHFAKRPKIEGCSIAFAHPLSGLEERHLAAIADYEIHLRYFIGMQRWAGFPHAFQTVGSSMAVRARIYCQIGGMNTRQAGEDFYFLHKIIERGKFSDLNTTTVYPSPRISDRVPFGTGQSMKEQLILNAKLTTYHPVAFMHFKRFIELIPLLYSSGISNFNFILSHHLHPALRTFLLENHAGSKVWEVLTHTASEKAFTKRFFNWFNAFLLMKYLHFARDLFYPNFPVREAAVVYFKLIGHAEGLPTDRLEILQKMRYLDQVSYSREM